MSRHLDLNDAATLLGVPRETIARWVREGVIPTHKHGRIPVFRRVELLQWAREHRLGCVEEAIEAHAKTQGANLSTALRNGGVHVDLPGADVAEVLNNAVVRAPLDDAVDRNLLLRHLLDRESIVSTGIGDGVALPHPHNPLEFGFQASRVCCFFLEHPIDYHALDGREVFCLFLVLAVDTEHHLKLMSQLAHALTSPAFADLLRAHASMPDLLAAIEEACP